MPRRGPRAHARVHPHAAALRAQDRRPDAPRRATRRAARRGPRARSPRQAEPGRRRRRQCRGRRRAPRRRSGPLMMMTTGITFVAGDERRARGSALFLSNRAEKPAHHVLPSFLPSFFGEDTFFFYFLRVASRSAHATNSRLWVPMSRIINQSRGDLPRPSPSTPSLLTLLKIHPSSQPYPPTSFTSHGVSPPHSPHTRNRPKSSALS
mmetsp:Transcript_5169/g.21276  ORF Transcript_5169/g.21276 Transcript_5169/m.21276 type:complete len:208 (-) Transcript_5169:81-704(-)